MKACFSVKLRSMAIVELGYSQVEELEGVTNVSWKANFLVERLVSIAFLDTSVSEQ